MRKIIVYLLIISFFTGCSSDKNDPLTDNLEGKWKLTAFVNDTNGTTLRASDFENSNEITIDFKEDFSYLGYTVLNDFFGSYSIIDTDIDTEKLLVLNDVNATEVNETDWGHLFFDTLNLNYNQTTKNWDNKYKLSNNVLKLYYLEDEYMELEKI